ncbi:TadE/TadG family type IV pilus assembly protein [Halodesulfovibrio aestuarii]|uniref:TadE-like protein n=1 Tax=Halodesulfovibrio aestuarii TaxID=126333 RepID=A0A8G2C8G4_9BACT|nr:TadE/TadG family type IV pilus assembly protein [Halodesulfovibrio aestuarii]SHI81152.1 TadE-like protein [Halodesulfovibrio aestuarii]
MRSSRALFRHEQGASALEMALILPLLLVLLFGIIDMGRYYWAEHSVAHAANEAARMAILEGVTSDEINEVIAFHLRDWDNTPPALQIVENPGGSGSPASVTVTVSIPFSFLVIPTFVTGIFEPITIRHSVTMHLER